MNKHFFICCLILSSICCSISANHLKNQLRRLCFKSGEKAICDYENNDVKLQKRLPKEPKNTVISILYPNGAIRILTIQQYRKNNKKGLVVWGQIEDESAESASA